MKNLERLILTLAAVGLISLGFAGSAAAQLNTTGCTVDSDCNVGEVCQRNTCQTAACYSRTYQHSGPTTAVFYKWPGDYIHVLGCDPNTTASMSCDDSSCGTNYYSFMRENAPACGNNICYWPDADEPCAYEDPVQQVDGTWVWPKSSCGGSQAVPFHHKHMISPGKYTVTANGAACNINGGVIAEITPCNC